MSAQALNSTARVVAGDLFGVDPYLVRVFMRDDAGFLALGINLPLPIVAVAGRTTGSLMDRARAQRTLLGEKFTELTGAVVSRVDVRITGVVNAHPKESP
ncbi:hypothetical protein [Paeniglutamicibacter kerguelensis]|uniref:Mannose/fructose-specific phosphotransferase system component IIA n=1 Tax=Paeniglutamicibacter kerguelensis TaxID=254788 RepID=A0ABS4XJZ1_9MICC|nr:hypothetical protein [Paeniglutamicibacter kerguelensis]MBP2388792.1 mannose/fructose-specific phosphotransferase system component IIA [Paeniglutamicibacter kerguelensis]